MNADRKKGGDLNKVTYEAFEIIMNRLETEWIDLVRNLGVHLFRAARTILNFLVYRDQYPSSKYKSIFGDVLFSYASWTVRIANLKIMGKFPRPSRHPYDESDWGSDSLETNSPRTPRYREQPLPESSLSQRKKVSIEEWRNSVIEGGAEMREIQVRDAPEWEVESSTF